MEEFSGDLETLEVHELDLIPMIAIFSMLILFLIAGTVLTNEDIQIPNHLNPPKGMKNQILTGSPRILVAGGVVTVSEPDSRIDVGLLVLNQRPHQQRHEFRTRIKEFKEKSQTGKKIIPFQLVADRSLSYHTLYQVINELQFDGIESFLFISEVEP